MENNYSTYRNVITRCFYGYCLIWLLERTFSQALPPQLLSPQLSETGYNLTFWFYRLSGISQLISSQWLAWMAFRNFDVRHALYFNLFPTKKPVGNFLYILVAYAGRHN